MTKGNSTTKATVAPVRIGKLVVEGIMLPDGSFGVATLQVYDLFGGDTILQGDKKYTTQALKRLCGEAFQSHKTFIPELNTGKRNQNKKSYISLKIFELAVAKLDRAGNKKAQDFRDDLVGVSLEQEFSRAFGIKFEEEDFQKRLVQRQLHRELFHPDLTYWWKIDGLKNGIEYAKRVNEFKRTVELPVKPVDEYDHYEIAKLTNHYSAYSVLRKVGKSHSEALREI